VKFFAWLKANSFAGRDGDFSAGTRVPSDAGFARFDRKNSKTPEFDAIARDEGLLHAVEDRVHRSLCFSPGESGAFNNPLYKVLLNHLGRRP
jgi:hypothetical protein